MKLLFLTSRLPWPPDRGDRLRTYNLLVHLSKRHKITLVSFFAERWQINESTPLFDICDDVHFVHLPYWRSVLSVISRFWRGRPLQVEFYHSKKMGYLIERLLKNYQFPAVYIHLFRMAPYLKNNQDSYHIVDLTDAISQEILQSLPYRSRASRLIHRIEQRRIKNYECQVMGWADETWVISERDRQILSDGCSGGNLKVVPNGVNLKQFYPQEDCQKKYDLVFVGNLDVLHNIDALNFFVGEIFPLIRTKMPACTMAIIGAGEGKHMAHLGKLPGVILEGYVNNLNDALNRAHIFIAPLRFSAGVQNKALEAMACAIPVLCTSGVASGLGARPGKDLIVADDAQDFAEKALTLLQSEQARRTIGQSGRNLVAIKFGWQAAIERVQFIEKSLNIVDSSLMNGLS